MAVADWALRELDLARLQLEHSVPNAASCRVAEASGFRIEGTLRSSFQTSDGVRYDDHVHGRLAIDPPP
jgi:RimJ/RimL family protein N-acetyltransferase